MPEQIHQHETSDISVKAASWFAVALVLSVGVIAFLVWRMEVFMDPTQSSRPHQPSDQVQRFEASGPVLQSAPAEDLRILREREDQASQSYAWVERKEGVIRIPVARGKELILQRGLPATGTSMPLPGPSATPIPEKGGPP